MLRYCRDDTLAGGTRPRRLVIYQRDSDRRLLDLDGNIRVLQELLGPSWRVVDILHDNKHEPCWLYSQLMDADMLLTPHGYVDTHHCSAWQHGNAPPATPVEAVVLSRCSSVYPFFSRGVVKK